ncbi:MAG: low molecular weight protein-tyrosine-phosphatase [Mariprofundaceae bacterium]|nr:low molecular weight protein-tyrosine-phosphatase [Mariprofundaceae bacterium]
MFNTILVVCVGNICRSPMAEALLQARAPEGVHVYSAGIGALVGESADPLAQVLMQKRAIDISAHRARQLTREMVCQAKLILVMEEKHQQYIHSLSPAVRGKVHCLGKWNNQVNAGHGREYPLGDQQVPDPYKKSPEYFEHVLEMIEKGVDGWATKLWK